MKKDLLLETHNGSLFECTEVTTHYVVELSNGNQIDITQPEYKISGDERSYYIDRASALLSDII